MLRRNLFSCQKGETFQSVPLWKMQRSGTIHTKLLEGGTFCQNAVLLFPEATRRGYALPVALFTIKTNAPDSNLDTTRARYNTHSVASLSWSFRNSMRAFPTLTPRPTPGLIFPPALFRPHFIVFSTFFTVFQELAVSVNQVSSPYVLGTQRLTKK